MRDASIAVIREIGVETGGSNIQFAIHPENGRMVVIEMNPRVSRSSALASKATGFPIAKIAAKLAVGYRLHELPNDITRETHGLLRADDRLRRGQDPALRLREIPRGRRRPDHADEERGRDDGHRPHLQGGVSEGAARAGSRQLRLRLRRQGPVGHAPPAELSTTSAPTRSARRPPRLVPPLRHQVRHVDRGDPRADRDRSLVPRQPPGDRRDGGEASRRTRAGGRRRPRCCARPSSSASPTASWRRSGASTEMDRSRRAQAPRHRGHVQVRRHLRRRVRGLHALLLLDLRGRRRDAAQAARTSSAS